MRPTRALLLLALLVGLAATPAAAHQHGDGDRTNGEELAAGSDDDDGIYPINYTFRPDSHAPGHVDGAAEHYAEGLTENGTLHWIVVSSPDFDFSNCAPAKTNAFGIDRGNDEPGTTTDESLLSAYKSFTPTADAIRIAFFKEEGLAGGPMGGRIDDQIAARQSNCYDNPDEPGWYRVDGKINGSTTGDAATDYVIVDRTDWIYICECGSEAEAREQLGPPPGEGGDGGAAAAASPTATPTPAAEPTPTPTAGAAAQTDAPDADGTDGAAATPTPDSAASGADGRRATGAGEGPTATADSRATAQGTAAAGGDGPVPRTPTLAEGPGFGAAAALLTLVAAALVAVRSADP